MKNILLLIFIVALFHPVFCNEQQKDSTNIGYYVVIEKNGKIQPFLKTNQLAEVYAFIQVSFPAFCADVEIELKDSPVFIQTTANNEIYIEKMRIVNGKYKRLKRTE